MNKRRVGELYEEKALAYLKKQGFRLCTKNFRVRQGEIDLIGYDGNTLVFAEVKYRRGKGLKNAMESVTYQKQVQICRISLFYLNKYKISLQSAIRYDVIAIDDGKICWIKNAFPFRG